MTDTTKENPDTMDLEKFLDIQEKFLRLATAETFTEWLAELLYRGIAVIPQPEMIYGVGARPILLVPQKLYDSMPKDRGKP